MSDKTITAIMMAAAPLKTEYVVGFDNLDLAGGLLNLVYANGNFEQVPLSEQMEYFVDNSVIGTSTVTVRFAGYQTGFPILIRSPKLSKVTIIAPPSKTTYMDGEQLDLAGLRLMGHYDNGEEREISPVPTLQHQVKLGEAVVPLPVGHILIPILITVTPSTPVSLSVYAMPSKTTYIERLEALDVSGGLLEKKLSNGRVELVPMTSDMVSEFDNAKVGKQTLRASYGGKTCTFEVEVVSRVCNRLELRSLPIKRSYMEGETFDLTGLELIAKHEELSWVVTPDELMLPEPVARAGMLNIVVRYQNQSVDIPISIAKKEICGISIHTMPNNTVYKEPEENQSIFIDPTGGQIAVQYNNGTVDLIALGEAEVESIKHGAIGAHTIQVKYNGFQTSLEVTVEPRKLLGIYITKPPAKTNYKAGEFFDTNGLLVIGFYDNGQTAEVSRYTYPTKPLTPTDTTVVITYIDKTAVVPIMVGPTAKTHSIPQLRRRAAKKSSMELRKAERFYPGTLGLRFEE